jgi:hypothetical protein
MRQPESMLSTNAIPIACDPRVFTQEQREAHVALAESVLRAWPKARRELEDGFVFEYDGDDERFLAVAGWAAAEHRCCPWASFSVEMGPFAAGQPGQIALRFRGGAEGKAILVAALEAFERKDLNVDAFLRGDKLTAETFRAGASPEPQRKGGCGC